MAQTIQLRRSSTANKVPTTAQLSLGEIAINTNDGRIFFEKDDGSPSIQQIITTNSETTGSITLTGTGSFQHLLVGASSGQPGFAATINGGLYVSSSVGGATVVKIVGTSGSLFEIIDSFQGILMSVNDQGGVPILAVSSSGNVGINQPNPAYTLDVNGTGSFSSIIGNGSGLTNVIAAGVAANSVALGTGTTGNYVGTITAGTGISTTGATTGEGIAHTISTNDSQIVHDNLSGFVADEHIAHSSVSITAGNGLTGGGTIAASRTIDVGAGSGISVAADSVSVDSTVLRTTGAVGVVSSSAQINHDSTTGFVADEHVAHSSITFSAGDGLSGGGTLAANRSFAVDSTVLRTTGAVGVISSSAQVNHDSTTGFVADEHVAHGSVSITAGNGLTGGGTIAASRTINVGGGDGISVAADTVGVDSTVLRTTGAVGVISSSAQVNHDSTTGFVADEHVAHGSVSITAGSGLTGGGTIAASRTINVGAGDGISVAADTVGVDGTVLRTTGGGIVSSSGQINHDSTTGFVADEHVAHSSVTFTAGDGLSGGGTLAANRSFAVDSTVLRTTGAVGVISSSAQVNHDSTTGFVANEHIDHSTVSITAGNGLTGGGTIASTRTIDVGAGSGISVAADSVSVDSTVLRTTGAVGVISSSAQVTHDSTTGFVADEHVAHSSVTLTAGVGLTGGGTIAASRTFDLDLNELTTSTSDGDGDYFVVVDTVGAQKKLTKGNINISGFNNNAGYTTNTGTVTSVTVSGSSGLTGNGTVSTSGTINIQHADTSAQGSVNNSGRTYIQDVTLDDYGHVTGLVSATETISGTVTSVTVSGSTGLTGTGTVTTSGTINIQHADTSAQSSVNNSGRTYIQDVTLDNFGHVTGLVSATETISGTVTSVGGTGTVNGLTLSGTVTSSGSLVLGGSVSINNANWSGTDLSVANGGTGASTLTGLVKGNGTSAMTTITDNSSNWNTAFGWGNHAVQGYAVTGSNITVFTNNAGYTSNTGTVTSVSGTGTVNGLTLSGTVTTSGNLTLGGSLSIDNSNWSGTDLSVSNGGTGASTLTGLVKGNGTSAMTTITDNSSNWNTAFGWGDHGVQGYAVTGSNITVFTNNAGYTSNTGTVTSVTVGAGSGLTGGGTVTTSGTATLNVGAGDGISVAADTVGVDGTVLRTTGGGIVSSSGQISHDSTSGFVADEHVAHGSVSITAGNGLTGGGTIAASRTINVGAGSGISVAADSVAVDSTVLRTTGGGIVSASGQINHDSTTGFVADEHVAHGSVSITGTGVLGGGGTIASSRTISHNVSGVTANSYGGTNDGNAIESITVDTYGHITAIAARDFDTRYAQNAFLSFTTDTFAISADSNSDVASITGGTDIQVAGTTATDSIVISFTNDTGYTTNTGTVTSVTVGAGNGLTGGGTITTSGTATVNVVGGNGITVNADNIELSGAYTGTWAVTGAITATGDITAFSSDERLKDNIVEIDNAMSKIKQLRGVTFDWNETADQIGLPYTERHDLGVIAQDVQRVLPEAVRPAPVDPEYLTVRYDKLVALLIEGMKEQQDQIDQLKEEIRQLKG